MIWWRVAAMRRSESYKFTATKCVNFAAASTQYVDFGNAFAFERTQPWSVSVWVKRTGSGTIFGKVSNATSWRGFRAFFYTDGRVHVHLVSDDATNCIKVYSNTIVEAGAWTHIVVTYDGSSALSGVKVYINGTLTTMGSFANTLTQSIVDTSPFRFGALAVDDLRLYDGQLDDVAIYSAELNSSQVTALYNSGTPNEPAQSNLIGWYPMGDGDTYPTITDRSTGGHNGTMTNMSAGSIVTR